MKTIFTLLILFFLIALPALGELTDADLNQIRLIVQEEISKEIEPIKTDIVTLKTDVAWVRGKFESIDQQFKGIDQRFEGINDQFESVNQRITHATNVSYGLIALIVSAIAIPQIIMAWRSKKDRALEKQIQTLAQEIETLKQKQIIQP